MEVNMSWYVTLSYKLVGVFVMICAVFFYKIKPKILLYFSIESHIFTCPHRISLLLQPFAMVDLRCGGLHSLHIAASIFILLHLRHQHWPLSKWPALYILSPSTACIVCGAGSVKLSCAHLFFIHLSSLHSATASHCGGFAAVGPSGRRYRSIAAQQQMRAVSHCQLT